MCVEIVTLVAFLLRFCCIKFIQNAHNVYWRTFMGIYWLWLSARQDYEHTLVYVLWDRRASCLLLLFSILIILYHDDASFVYIRVYQHIIFAQKILSMPFYRYIHCTHHRHIRYKERVEQRIYTCLVQIFCTHHFLFLVLFYININMYTYIVRAATHL